MKYLITFKAPNVHTLVKEGSVTKGKNYTTGEKIIVERTNSHIEVLKAQKQLSVRKAMKSEESKYPTVVLVQDNEEGGDN